VAVTSPRDSRIDEGLDRLARGLVAEDGGAKALRELRLAEWRLLGAVPPGELVQSLRVAVIDGLLLRLELIKLPVIVAPP
jgi:hypothetical protein